MRLTHWGIAAAVVANGLFTEEGSSWHVWVGYAAGGLLALRLVWGVVGPRPARFAAFPPSPRRALGHVRDIAAGRKTVHGSHNPLGALMVYALWLTLAVVIGSGIAMAGPPPALGGATGLKAEVEAMSPPSVPRAAHAKDDDDQDQGAAGESGEGARAEAGKARDGGEAGEGSEGGEAGEAGEEVMEEVHEAAANLLFVLAAVHVAGVAFETRRSGPGVVRRMLGRRPRAEPAE